ncbi:MAG: chemotaxis protein CheA [Rickettsiales bacterium]
MNDLAQFKATYIAECKELLQDMEEQLLSLTNSDNEIEVLNGIFRCAHSIKGGAGAFGLTELSHFTHALETLLDKMRDGQISPQQDIIDLLLESGDILEKMVLAAESNQAVEAGLGKKMEEELLRMADCKPMVKKESVKPQEEEQNKFFNIKFAPHANILRTGNEPTLIFNELRQLGTLVIKTDSSKVPEFANMNVEDAYFNYHLELETKKPEDDVHAAFEFVIDDCALSIEQVAGLFDMTQKAQATAVEILAAPANGNENHTQNEAATKVVSSIRVDVEKIDRLVNLVGELVITQAMIVDQTKSLGFDEFSGLLAGVEELSHHTRELQDAVMSVRMQPVKSLFSRLPRLVRDLSRQLNKDIVLEVSGESTEIDKSVIEQLSDPLTHMIRNSVDHGVETPEIRKENGKNPQGTIKLSADQVSGKIVISIQDDGAGINREKVRKKAIEKGIISEQEAALLSPGQIDKLIFAAGFSTADNVSDVSGRGVGMDVVRRNIESIGGSVEIFNDPGKGLKMNVYIPLTLAIMDGMIVSSGSEIYIIPISNIVETLKPKVDDLKKIADGNDVISLRGEFIQVYYLYELFNIQNSKTLASEALVVIIEVNNQKYGLVVDELLGQQQIVIKSLDQNSNSIEGLSGATILGDGKVSLILDMVKIPNLAAKIVNKIAA